MNVTEYLTCWAASYKNDLINNIMPFWMKYGLDQVNGVKGAFISPVIFSIISYICK